MKCNKAKNLILLEQSGELGEREVQQLRRHLGACESCRRFQNDAAKLTPAKTQVPLTPDYVLHAIRQAALREQVAGKKDQGILVFWRPLAAAAAGVLLAVLSWSVIRDRGVSPVQVARHWDNSIDVKLESLELQISSASYEFESAGEWYEEDADELAAELLAMEEST